MREPLPARLFSLYVGPAVEPMAKAKHSHPNRACREHSAFPLRGWAQDTRRHQAPEDDRAGDSGFLLPFDGFETLDGISFF